MAHLSSNPCSPESSTTAVRWVVLAERVVVCSRMLRDELARHAGRVGLGEPEFSLLWACREAPPAGMGQNELAAQLAVSPAQVSALVEKLRRVGLLECRRAENDRRRQLWRLTPAGQGTLHDTLAGMADWASRLDRRLGSEACRELVRALDRLLLPDAETPHAEQRGAA